MSDTEISLLSDCTKTNKEIAELLKCSIVTISRKRKKYGIIVPRGLKPGQHNNKITKYKTNCIKCGNLFELTPCRKFTAKYCSKNCMYISEEYHNILKNVDKSYMKSEQYRKTKSKEDTPEYRKFRNRVANLTEYVYNENMSKINPNNYMRTLAGIDGGYHLDHIISCREGFDKGYTPEQISDVTNLQMLPWRDNVVKGKK